MEYFNAEDAKRATKKALMSPESIMSILNEIKKEAEKGKSYLDTRKPLSKLELEELINRGFKVEKHNSLTVQMDGLYDKISW